MAAYIDKEGRKEMADLLKKFLEETDHGKNMTPKGERIINRLFTKYIDKIVHGVIYSPRFRLYSFGDPDDLFQVGRIEAYKALVKGQWNEERGTIFTFLTTVIKRNITWHTRYKNEKEGRFKYASEFEFDNLANDEKYTHMENHDKQFLMDYVFEEIRIFFSQKTKMERLADIFIEYWKINDGKKFVKKDFIEYASTYTFSPSLCHSFFNNLKKIKSIKKIINDSN